MSIADTLAAHTTGIVKQIIRGTPIYWKVRKLSPMQLATLPAMIQSILKFVTASKAELDAAAEQGREAELPAEPSREDQERFATNMEAVIRLAVVAVSTDQAMWEPIFLVPSEEEDPSASKLSIATLDAQTSTAIMTVALQGALEAGDIVRPFRGRRDGDGATVGRDGPEVPLPTP